MDPLRRYSEICSSHVPSCQHVTTQILRHLHPHVILKPRSQKPVSVAPTEDLFEEEYVWNVPEVQVQPATFPSQSSPSPAEPSPGSSSEPLNGAVVSPVSSENPVVSVPETMHFTF